MKLFAIIKGLLGNSILYLGSSPGTNGELNYAIYLYKIITAQKENLKVLKEKIHPEIKADKDFKIFVYQPFLLNNKLDSETESYIKKFNIKLVYIDNPLNKVTSKRGFSIYPTPAECNTIKGIGYIKNFWDY